MARPIPNSVRKIRKGRRVVGTIKVQAHERRVFSTVSAPSRRLVTLWEACQHVRRAVDLMQLCNARLTNEERGYVEDMQIQLKTLTTRRHWRR